LKTVFSDTSAARATSATVDLVEAMGLEELHRRRAIASRVWRFLRSRRPSVVAAMVPGA